MSFSADLFIHLGILGATMVAVLLFLRKSKGLLRAAALYAAIWVLLFQISALVLTSPQMADWHNPGGQILFFSLALLIPLGTHFAYVWDKGPNAKGRKRKWVFLTFNWLLGLSLAALIGAGKLRLVSGDGGRILVSSNPFSHTLLGTLIVASVLTLSVVERKLRMTSGNRVAWIPPLMFSAIFVFIIIAASRLLLVHSLNRYLLVLMSGAACLSYISLLLMRSNLFRDTDLSIDKRATAFSSFMVLTVGAYLVAIGIAGKVMSMSGGNVEIFFSVLTGIAAAVLFLALISSISFKDRIRRFVDRIFYAGEYDYRAIWSHFAEETALVQTLDELNQSILDNISLFMEANIGALLLVRPGSGHLTLVKKKISNCMILK